MTAPAIRVLVVDDQALFREGLTLVLQAQPDMSVIAEASNGDEAIRLAGQLQPDVILMDLRMPGRDGVSATKHIIAANPTARVIVLTTFDDDEDVFAALRAGAAGYLLKDVSGDTLISAMRAAVRGESFLAPAIATKVVAELNRLAGQPPAPLAEPLSDREREVLALLATGATNRDLADRLYITEGTVKNHITSILSKLGVRDRGQAVIRAEAIGLLSSPRRVTSENMT